MISLCASCAKLSQDCTCCAKYRHSNLHVDWSQSSWLMAQEILYLQQQLSHCTPTWYLIVLISSVWVEFKKPICQLKPTQVWKRFEEKVFNALLLAVLLSGGVLYLVGRISCSTSSHRVHCVLHTWKTLKNAWSTTKTAACRLLMGRL